MKEGEESTGNLGDTFDRIAAALDGKPDTISVKASTVMTKTFLGLTQTSIVQTVRQNDYGDTIFLQMITKDGSMRVALPPAVADLIARQREALTAKNRSRGAKAAAMDRKAKGFVPHFGKKK